MNIPDLLFVMPGYFAERRIVMRRPGAIR